MSETNGEQQQEGVRLVSAAEFPGVVVQPFEEVGTRRQGLQARITVNGIVLLDPDDEVGEAAKYAARLVLMGAGLRAAIGCGQDIFPWLPVGTNFTRPGGEVGVVERRNNDERTVTVRWDGDDVVTHTPDQLRDLLRLGTWRLP